MTKGKKYDEDLDGLIRDKIEQSGIYKQASWRFMAEIYPEPDENGIPTFGYYISCQPLSKKEKAKLAKEKRK